MARIDENAAQIIIRGIREIRGQAVLSINLLIDNNRQRRLNRLWSSFPSDRLPVAPEWGNMVP
jgi:hypothetical protein